MKMVVIKSVNVDEWLSYLGQKFFEPLQVKCFRSVCPPLHRELTGRSCR